MSCALGANLMVACHGLTVPVSGFLIPQLEDPKIGFGINKEEGSWLGKCSRHKNLKNCKCE